MQWAAAEFGVDLTSMDLEGGVEELGALDSSTSSSHSDSSSVIISREGEVAAADSGSVNEEHSAELTESPAAADSEIAEPVLTSGLGAFRNDKPLSSGPSANVVPAAAAVAKKEVPVSSNEVDSVNGNSNVESEEPAADTGGATAEAAPAATANPWTSIFGLSWKKLAEPLPPLKSTNANSEPAATTAPTAAVISDDAATAAAAPAAASSLAADGAAASTASDPQSPPPKGDGDYEEQLAQLAAEAEARAAAAAAEEAVLKEEATQAASRAAASARAAAAKADAASQQAARIAAATTTGYTDVGGEVPPLQDDDDDESMAEARAQEAALLEEVWNFHVFLLPKCNSF